MLSAFDLLSLGALRGYSCVQSFKLHIINHGINGIEDTDFVLFRKLGNII